MTDKIDSTQMAKIAFVDKGGKGNFVFAVYKNGTVVFCKLKAADDPEDELIKMEANKILDSFPGFIKGTSLGDFNVSRGKYEWFGENSEHSWFITYPGHTGEFISCIVDYDNPTQAQVGMNARENVKKDIEEREIVFVGKHVPE